MKLLTPTDALAASKKEHDALMGKIMALREQERILLARMNSAKANYDPEKARALADFDAFTAELSVRRETLLKEVAGIEKAIEDKKDLYYALAAKTDELAEREHQIKETERKLELREAFISELERKQWSTTTAA